MRPVGHTRRAFHFSGTQQMTNKIALGLGILIFIGLSLDFHYLNWQGSLFLLKKLIDMIEWMAFWR